MEIAFIYIDKILSFIAFMLFLLFTNSRGEEHENPQNKVWSYTSDYSSNDLVTENIFIHTEVHSEYSLYLKKIFFSGNMFLYVFGF